MMVRQPPAWLERQLPVTLGRFRLLELVQLADFLETQVDELPGTRAGGVHFAVVFAGAAARAIEHAFGTAGDRANAAVEVEHTGAARATFFRPTPRSSRMPMNAVTKPSGGGRRRVNP